MRIAIVDQTGTCKTLVDKGYDCFLGSLQEKADGYFCGQLTPTNGTKPVANSCTAALRFSLDPDCLREYLDAVDCPPGKTESHVYGLFNGKDFSELIEVSYSDRFMNREVGPKLGFTCGTALKIQTDLTLALPQFKDIRESLESMNYRGEICLGINSDFEIVEILFGHFPGHFSLFAELSLNRIQDILEFIFGEIFNCPLREGLAVCNLVTKFPFPSYGDSRILAPKNAEAHLWRMFYPTNQEKILVTAQGNTLREAKQRVYRSIKNMLSYADELQYRSDFFNNKHFLLTLDEFEKMLPQSRKEFKKQEQPITANI